MDKEFHESWTNNNIYKDEQDIIDKTGQNTINTRSEQVSEESSRDENDSKGKWWSIQINTPSFYVKSYMKTYYWNSFTK